MDRNLVWLLGGGLLGLFLANTIFYPQQWIAAERKAEQDAKLAAAKAEAEEIAAYKPMTQEEINALRARFTQNQSPEFVQGPTIDVDYEVVSPPVGLLPPHVA